MIPWLGQYWAPHLLGAPVQRPLRRPRSSTARSRLRREELGRRVRRPLVVGPGRGRRVRGRADPRRRADRGRRLDARRPRHARAAARPHGRPRRRRRMAHPRAVAALAGGDRGRGAQTRCCCPSRSRTSAGSRSAPATTCSGRIAARVHRGRTLWLDREGPAALEDGATPVMTSSAMSSSPPRSRPSARSTWSHTASGRQPRRRSARSRSSSRPASIARVAVLDQPVGVEHDRGARGHLDGVALVLRRRRRPAAARAGGDERGAPSSGATSGGRCPASENVSRRAPGRRPPASTVAIGRSSSAGARALRVREHAVRRVAVVGVGGEHGAQLAHPRGGLRPVAHHVADHQQQPAVLERVPEVEVAADVAAAGARAGSARRGRSRAATAAPSAAASAGA